MRAGAFLLALCLASMDLALAAAEPEVSVERFGVTVRVEDVTGAPLALREQTRIVATSTAGAALELAPEPETMQVHLPTSGRWRLCLSATDLWADCQSVDVSAPPSRPEAPTPVATFVSWPAFEIRGQVRSVDDGKVPEGVDQKLKVFVGPPPGERPARGFRDVQLDCSVGEGGRFSCTSPATRLYVAVRLSGFVSRYFWNQTPESGEALDLGTVRLPRGASLAGDVDLRVEGLEPERVSVRLTPAMAPGTRTNVAASLAKDSQGVGVNALGFFQFGGLRPGLYMLQVTHPSFAVTELGPFEVFEGKETRLRDPIQLMPPVDISLLIEPSLSPSGRAWRVDVYRERDWSAGSVRVFSGQADLAGSLELKEQTPGLFAITLADQDGNRYHASKTRVQAGDSGFVPIEVPIVRVTGEVRLGSEPISATLRFGGRHGPLRTLISTDPEGSFAGALARDGEWTVEIENVELAIETVRRVEIDAGSDGRAHLEIELEDTELIGRVVSAEGQPVPDAQVKVDAFSEVVSKRVRSDGDGRFRLRALPAGGAMVTASARAPGGQLSSSPALVSLQENVSTGPLELVLRPLHSFTGQVSSATGPAPGARIHATIVDLPIPAVGSAVSDFEGRFELELPLAEGVAALTILPPGGFLTTALRRLENPLDLATASAGGTLVVRSPGNEGTEFVVMIEREGVQISHPLLAQWTRGHGIQTLPGPDRTATYPRMAEGNYRLCAIEERARRGLIREGRSWHQVADETARCVAGFLSPGGTLELSLDGD